MTWIDDNIMRPEAASVLGAVLGWLNAPGGTWYEQAFNLGSGICAAIFLAPWIAKLADISSQEGRLGSAFLLGLVGMNVLAKVIAWSKVVEWGDLLDLLSNLRKLNASKGDKP